MHILTRMARPADKEVPMSYFDFMTKDSVSVFVHLISCSFLLFLVIIFYDIVIDFVLFLSIFFL